VSGLVIASSDPFEEDHGLKKSSEMSLDRKSQKAPSAGFLALEVRKQALPVNLRAEEN
jgi:hypothetical protein